MKEGEGTIRSTVEIANQIQPFRDRAEAGQLLARKLTAYANRSDVTVLALPRGGVPVGFEIATALRAPLNIFLVRKLGVPGQEELAIGAVASGGVRVLDNDLVKALHISQRHVDALTAQAQRELERQEALYCGGIPRLNVCGRTVVLVDDGAATGATMLAAIAALRRQQVARLIVTVPVAPATTRERLAAEADEVVCLLSAEHFVAVGEYYHDFTQVSDEKVQELLHRSASEPCSARASGGGA